MGCAQGVCPILLQIQLSLILPADLSYRERNLTDEVDEAVAAMKSEEKSVKIVGSSVALLVGDIGRLAVLDFGPGIVLENA